jgi:hypothetical protein
LSSQQRRRFRLNRQAHKERAKETRRAWYEKNKQKHYAEAMARKAADPEKWKEQKRWHGIKQKYGITKDQYEQLFATQNGCCALCGRKEAEDNRLHIDHCHTTMVVRGLLCGHCNKALGLFRDNPDVIDRASAYLRGEVTYG